MKPISSRLNVRAVRGTLFTKFNCTELRIRSCVIYVNFIYSLKPFQMQNEAPMKRGALSGSRLTDCVIRSFIILFFAYYVE